MQTYIECIEERVEGGNLVTTLKFFTDHSPIQTQEKRILCVPVLSHATSKVCSSVLMKYVLLEIGVSSLSHKWSDGSLWLYHIS